MNSMLKLVTFDHKGTRKIGSLSHSNDVVDLTAATGFKDMKSLLEGGEKSLKIASDAFTSGKHRLPLQDIKIRAPIYNPEKIICVGLNYSDHAKESGMQIPPEPVLFSKFASSIIGPYDKIIKPRETNELDYEVELVVVMGKTGRRIKESEAQQYVAGYTVGHDVSARDWQLRKPGGQWMAGKTFDTFCSIGPSIVTKVSDPNGLNIRCTLNGQTVQSSNTNQFIFKVDKLVSYISNICTLKPGDLIFTGTPHGVGMGRKPQLWMKPGDKVICSIDELGELHNSVEDDIVAKL